MFVQALRLVDQRNVIRSDFVLISGDTARLQPVLSHILTRTICMVFCDSV